VLAGGGVATVGLSPPNELLVAVDAEDRSGGAGGRGRGIVARLAVGIEPEWLLDLGGAALTEKDDLVFNPATERVERVTSLAYGLVVLEETRRPAPPSPEASRLLAAAATEAGLKALSTDDAPDDLGARLETLRQAFPGDGIPSLDEAARVRALAAACEGRTSFAELRAVGREELLHALVPPELWQRLRNDAPERIRLPGGREVQVHYEADKPPWIESRLQDFFGLQTGPAVARGRVPLVLHLLAPNYRAVQVTRDLAGFWQKHYPALRRELSRRYPRHAWPEDGATATPPPPKPPRPRT
jgi:ATP-dependent helicase HrpB